MSENTIFVRQYKASDIPSLAKINENEVYRYAGYYNILHVDENINNLLLDAIKKANEVLTYKVCFRRMDIHWENDRSVLPFLCDSKDLDKCLKGSDEIIMFAATIGMGVDRLIKRYNKTEMTRTLLLQALGAERVETLCDYFCDEIASELNCENKILTPRYSPGYGDMLLEHQRDFFNLLDCNRKVGISLGESLLMTPSKSVTAIMGIKNVTDMSKNKKDYKHKCETCNNKDCEYRKVNDI